jgi:hypothetical protein
MNALVDSAPPVAAYSIVGIHVIVGEPAFAQGISHPEPNGTCANNEQAIAFGDSVQHALPIELFKLKHLV